jgi:CheY-like chemotaxis protein
LEFDRYGRDTLSVLKQQVKVDLIILDMMLPKGDSGFDIFDNIRTEPEFAKTPIVAVSASDVSEAMPRARKMGFSGYIAKPINQLLFPAQLARIIAGEEVWYAADKYGNE